MKDQFFRKHKGSRSGRDIDQTLKHIIATRNDRSFCLPTFRCKQCNRIDLFIL